jgi:pimeloyl-ACP methyl ester carboxylesterase
MAFEDVVVLVPGFLGFSRVGGFYYFADRVSATLRAALQAATKRTIPVVPCCALPTDRLAKRQDKLLASLAELCERLGEVKRLHLVGHSAGGVDAQLLTCDRPLARGRWRSDDERVREKIVTVVGIASPHQGTCLSNAQLAQLLAEPLKQLVTDPVAQIALLPSAGRQLWDLARLTRYGSEEDIVYSVLGHLPDSSKFLWSMVGHRGLIEDLQPRAMEATRLHWSKGKARLRSFVTVVPSPTTGDPFFQDLNRLTADTQQSPATEATKRAATLLNERARIAIRSSAAVPAFDDRVNDGVVNSVRQLVDPTDPDELAGIVVADHADVLGHYDREDAFVSGKPLNMGLFHSGAGFGDDQFYTLYGRVADVLAGGMA